MLTSLLTEHLRDGVVQRSEFRMERNFFLFAQQAKQLPIHPSLPGPGFNKTLVSFAAEIIRERIHVYIL